MHYFVYSKATVDVFDNLLNESNKRNWRQLRQVYYIPQVLQYYVIVIYTLRHHQKLASLLLIALKISQEF